MVEAPGTAPGSDGFITIAIYRHSWFPSPFNIVKQAEISIQNQDFDALGQKSGDFIPKRADSYALGLKLVAFSKRLHTEYAAAAN